MPSYVVVMVTVEDPETYREYTERAPVTIARHGGRFLVRGGTVRALEGEPYEGRLVIMEFPTAEAADQWFSDPDYQSIARLRRAASTGRLLLADGMPDEP